ncbi:hypothetical protein ANRL3_01962 [Anaerolineae bacterium]|nr:hypothetical protein ANRL3_01962 [Anaerolineae bacterium]
MKSHKPTTFRYAICVNNSEYPASLELHKVYRVLPDADAAKDGDLRVIDESGEDYLYPANYFLLVGLPRETVRVLNKSFTHKPQTVAA